MAVLCRASKASVTQLPTETPDSKSNSMFYFQVNMIFDGDDETKVNKIVQKE